MSITRKRFFDFTITINDQLIRLQLKRMTVPEFAAFEAKFVQIGEGRGKPPIPDDPAAATRAQLDAEVEYLTRNAEWQSEVFEQFVAVLPGQVFDEDVEGNPIAVTNGRALADMFPGDPAFTEILLRLYIDNRLTEEQKKRLRSPSVSAPGSTHERKTATAGERLDPVAMPARPEDSAALEAATAPFSDRSSGTTAPSSSASVPCGI